MYLKCMILTSETQRKTYNCMDPTVTSTIHCSLQLRRRRRRRRTPGWVTWCE
jgi:hypothetical protein